MRSRDENATAATVRTARIKGLQDRIRQWNCDALLITNANDIRYLTGFSGDDSWAVVRQRAKQVHILSDFRFIEAIAQEAPQAKAITEGVALPKKLAKLAKSLKLGKIAIQADHVTIAARKSLASELGARNLKDVDAGLYLQRAVKTDDEVNQIRRALQIQEQGYREMLAFLKPGQTEMEIAAFLEYRMRALGADGVSFPTIAAAGANASLPHAVPGQAKVKRNGILLIDWGAKHAGYCSDLTRVVSLGKMPAKIREIYAIVLDAQLAAIDAIKPGVAEADVDQAARDVIEKAGYGKAFGHSTGHGIGLDIHEWPRLSGRSKGVLQAGHVVTVEPGIYLPGVGGVRIEDDILVTSAGHEVLSTLPKDLESAMI